MEFKTCKFNYTAALRMDGARWTCERTTDRTAYEGLVSLFMTTANYSTVTDLPGVHDGHNGYTAEVL